MIVWESLGMNSGEPKFRFPALVEVYTLDVSTLSTMWSVNVEARHFQIVHDYFSTQDEAFEFIEVVVNMLAIKYPNAVCSNFSFLNKE